MRGFPRAGHAGFASGPRRRPGRPCGRPVENIESRMQLDPEVVRVGILLLFVAASSLLTVTVQTPTGAIGRAPAWMSTIPLTGPSVMTSGTLTCLATAYVSGGIQSDPFEPVGATNLLSPYFGSGLAIQ